MSDPASDTRWCTKAVLIDRRSLALAVPPSAAYRAVCRLGGENGWYTTHGLWRIRGTIDRIVGGPGLHRGRRDPDNLALGDTVDFWRVTRLEENRLVILRAEMKVPGVAELGFDIEPRDDVGNAIHSETADALRSQVTQTARFCPSGVAGLAYWYSLMPLHRIVFRRLLLDIRSVAEQIVANSRRAPPGS